MGSYKRDEKFNKCRNDHIFNIIKYQKFGEGFMLSDHLRNLNKQNSM